MFFCEFDTLFFFFLQAIPRCETLILHWDGRGFDLSVVYLGVDEN